MYSSFPFLENCSVSYLSLVYGGSLWAELNGGENSLHWKANMLPLFSIMTLWFSYVIKTLRYRNIDMTHVIGFIMHPRPPGRHIGIDC